MRSIKIFAIVLLLLMTLSSCTMRTETFQSTETATTSDQTTTPTTIPNTTGPEKTVLDVISVHFIDVGQGDSILIQSQKGNMLIDAGENNQGTVVVDYIKSKGISSLDYVVATHPHSDHIGGLDTVINQMDVKNVLMPKVTHTTKTFEDFLLAMKNKGIKPTIAKAPNTFNVGDLKFTILSPFRESYDNLNNYSVVLKMEYGDTSFLFTGDAEASVENEILANGYNVSAQIYKAAHHGSTTSNTDAFLDTVAPKVAVISVGKENDYGHPHQEILKMFEKRGIEVLRTDQLGTILLTSNGSEVLFQDNVIISMENDTPEEDSVYVTPTVSGLIKGNINSKGEKIYHMPGGVYYDKTDAEEYFTTEGEAIEHGYRKSSR